MRIDSSGYGGFYKTVREGLNDEQTLKLFMEVEKSKRFKLDELSHVVLRETGNIVGYIGSETAELCSPRIRRPVQYLLYHQQLKRIFNSV